MAKAFDIGHYPLVRELALADPELFGQIVRIFPFQDPLSGILVYDGELYFAFGFDNMEEFGFKFPITYSESKRRLSKPKHIPCLNQRKIVEIAYDRHVIVLTENGEAFGWGDNSGYPLGYNDRMFGSYSRPCLLASDAIKIAAGRKHTLFIDSDGFVFGVGDNRHGQTHPDLTIKVFRAATQNKEIRDKATDVYCTTHLSMALTTTNILYIWGQMCFKIINMVLSLERYGNVKKLLPIEFPFGVNMYDVRIMMLTEQKDVFQIKYVANFHKFQTEKLDTPGNIVDILGGRNGCYALIDENGNITMFRLDKNFREKKRIFTRIKSHIDAARLYRMPLQFDFFKLSKRAKDMSFIKKLGMFNSEKQTDFKIKWQRNASWILQLDRSVFFEHLPKLKHRITGNEFVWPDEPNTIPYGRLKPYRFNNKTRPSYITMYAYMVLVHTEKLPVGIKLNLDEFNYLVNYFKDVRSRKAFPSGFELTIIPIPEFPPPQMYEIDLELVKKKKLEYMRSPQYVPGNTTPEPVPLLELAPMSQEDIIKSYRTGSSETPCLFSKNPVVLNDQAEEMFRESQREETQNNQAQNPTGSIVEITEPVAGPSRMATLSEVSKTSASISNTLRLINSAQQSSRNQSINQSTSAVELANEDSMVTSVQSVPNPTIMQPVVTNCNLLEVVNLMPLITSFSQIDSSIREIVLPKAQVINRNTPSTSGVSQNPVTPSNTPSTSSSFRTFAIFFTPEQSESQTTANESINEESNKRMRMTNDDDDDNEENQ